MKAASPISATATASCRQVLRLFSQRLMPLRSLRHAHKANPVEPAIHSATARSASEKGSARKNSNPPSAIAFGPRSGQCIR